MDHIKEAVILAGGFGTRLRHVVSDVPKPMAPVKGKPFLSYLLDYMKECGFERIILSVGYMHEKIENFYGNSYSGMEILYATETEPLGTGGGILNAMQLVEGEAAAVVNGDTMFKVDFSSLEKFFFEKHTSLAIVLRKVSDTSRYGSVVTDSDGRITAFTEKNLSQGEGLINGGIYMVNKSLFDGFRPMENFSFEKDLMERKVNADKYYAVESGAYFIDIGIEEDYYRANEEF